MIFWAVFMTLCPAFLSSAVEPENHTPRQHVLHRGVMEGQQQLCAQVVFPEAAGSEAAAEPSSRGP